MKTSAALVLSLLVHALAAWLVFRHGRPAVAAKPKPPQVRATRVSLFSRPVERPAAAVARVEAPTRHLRTRPAALIAVPVETEGDVAIAAAPAADAAPEAGLAAEPAGGSPGPAVHGPAPAQPSFDAAALHARLADSAQRCYPAAARRFGLTGQATVDFCLDASGALSSTALSLSTGQALLDTAARDCVVKGALPFPTEAAGGCYSVPVRFGR
jgi:TonB family protein